jgi:hypothetical protein
MSKEKSVIVFNSAQHIKSQDTTPLRADDMIRESCEKVALAIGRQLLKRNLITFETEESPGANAGERRIKIHGTVSVNKPE